MYFLESTGSEPLICKSPLLAWPERLSVPFWSREGEWLKSLLINKDQRGWDSKALTPVDLQQGSPRTRFV